LLKELTIVEKDRVGLLADVSETLAKAGVNIESVQAESSGKQGIIRLLVSAPGKAKDALGKAGLNVLDSTIVAIRLPDKPGELAKLSRMLASASINILNIYLVSKSGGEVIDAIQTSDNEKAKKILKEYL
jgi:hypothetical protein